MTASDSDSDRPRRNWRIPTRIYGRVRTSTVLLGVCFVLTSLLYDQVRPLPDAATSGPQPIDTSQYTDVAPRQEYTAPSTPTPSATTTPTPTSTVDPSSTAVPGAPGTAPDGTGSPTGESGTTTTLDPTYLPGLTVPPQLRSLFPPAPGAPSTTGTP